jgi:hypothetical protein
MKWNYVAERAMMRAVGCHYPAFRNILKQPAVMA